MTAQRQSLHVQGALIVLFMVIVLTSVILGISYYTYQKKILLTKEQNELSSISYLKIREISQWRSERIDAGEYISGDILLVRQFIDYIKNQNNARLKSDILQSLTSLSKNFDFRDVLLLSPDGDIKLSYPSTDSLIGINLRSVLGEIVRKRNVVMSDIHRSDNVNFVHLDLVVPLVDHAQNDTLVQGLLALRVDPEKILFPILNSWPTLSNSGESILCRRDGNDIVYLSEVKNDRDSPLNLRIPVTAPKLPAAMATQGMTGTIDGIDYRNVPVVAAMNKVPGTPWFLVAKIDRQEVLVSLVGTLRMIVIILILIILTSASFIALLIRSQRSEFYRQKYEAERERLALIKHFDYILKYANDIIFLVDNDLKIVEANDRALEYYQYSREEFIGMKVETLRAPENVAELRKHITDVNENESATFETVHKRKDNSTFHIELSSRIVMIDGVKYYQGIGRDITERKKTESVLRESEEKFRKIFEENPVSILMTGKDMGIIRANSAFCKLVGYSEDELKMFTFRNLTHPDFIPNDELSLLRLVAGEIPVYHTEKKYIRKDRTEIWGSVTVNLIHSNTGEVQFFLVMIEDITARKKTMAELDNSLSLLRATLESTEDGLLVVDNSGRIIQYNERFLDMWRIPEEIIAKRDDNLALSFVSNQLIHPDAFRRTVVDYYRNINAITSDIIEFLDGRIFERFSRPQLVSGNSVGRVWSFRDITSMKKTEADLIAAKELAEESDRLKTAFLHNVSHEIRTPMNAIIGFSSLLNEPGLSEPEKKQYIEIIFQSGGQLLSIINDIVDIANVESGQAKINLSKFNLNSALRSLNEQFSIIARANDIEIRMNPGMPDTESEIVTDNTKLVQILSNLINNAVKFTKKGAIEYGYRLSGNWLEFYVNDTGIGISAEHLPRIFDRFYQVDSKVSRQYSGTGLGLSICKGFVELLGGSISVESEPGTGTKFMFVIPFRKD